MTRLSHSPFVRLRALVGFRDSVGSFEKGAVFTTSTTYGSGLVAKGLAVALDAEVVPLRSKQHLRVRAGSGLGDAIYLRCVVQALLAAGKTVEVACSYPDVFHGLPIKVEPFRREKIDIVAHYTQRKQATGSSQFQDMCAAASLPQNTPLEIKWTPLNEELLSAVHATAAGRRIVLVHGGRAPMGRTDGFGMELLPTREAMAALLGMLPKDMLLVQVGKGPQLYPIECELDLREKTSATDLYDLMSISYGAVSQCSFIIPLAEAFNKPLLVLWSAKGMAAKDPFVSSVRPEKVLHRKSTTSIFAIDDWEYLRVKGMVDAFCDI